MLSKHIVIETVIFRPRYQIKNIAWIYYFNMFTAQWAIEVAQTASTLMFTFRGNPHSIAHNLMSLQRLICTGFAERITLLIFYLYYYSNPIGIPHGLMGQIPIDSGREQS
ncbi:hypothetical protein ACJX0J_006086 [Zea mays]